MSDEARGFTSNDDEHILYYTGGGGAGAGNYYIKVVLAFSSPEQTYDLAIREAPSCIDDSYQPNDNETQAPLVTLPFHEADLRLCGVLAQDWFKLNLEADKTYVVDLGFTHAGGDVNAWLYAESDYVTVLGSGTSTTDNERFEYTVPTGNGGVHYVKIALGAGSDNQAYSAAFGEKFTCGGPAPLLTGVPDQGDTTGASMLEAWPTCGGSNESPDNIWRFTPVSNGTATVTVTPTGFDATMAIYHGAYCGDAMNEDYCSDDGQSDGDPESLAFAVTAGTTYYVAVSGYDDTEFGPYTITLSIL